MTTLVAGLTAGGAATTPPPGRCRPRLAEDARRATVIRADLFSTADQAAEFAMVKARQVIDEQGADVFS